LRVVQLDGMAALGHCHREHAKIRPEHRYRYAVDANRPAGNEGNGEGEHTRDIRVDAAGNAVVPKPVQLKSSLTQLPGRFGVVYAEPVVSYASALAGIERPQGVDWTVEHHRVEQSEILEGIGKGQKIQSRQLPLVNDSKGERMLIAVYLDAAARVDVREPRPI